MKPAVLCGVTFPKYTYFRRKGAHAGLKLSSSSAPALQGPHMHPPCRSRSSADSSRGLCCLPQLHLPPGASLGSLLPFPPDGGLSHRLGVAGHVPKFNKRSACTRLRGTQTPGGLEIKAASANPLCLAASCQAVALLRSHQGQADMGCVCHSRGGMCVQTLSVGVSLGGPFSPTGVCVGSFPRMGTLEGPLRAGLTASNQPSVVKTSLGRDALQCGP